MSPQSRDVLTCPAQDVGHFTNTVVPYQQIYAENMAVKLLRILILWPAVLIFVVCNVCFIKLMAKAVQMSGAFFEGSLGSMFVHVEKKRQHSQTVK